MTKVIRIAVLVSLITFSLTVKAASMGPVLKNFGPIYPVKDMDVPLPENYQFKAVFDVIRTASEPNNHSRRLESVARFINMHVDRGVPLEKLSLAVVFHGKATRDILTDEKYQSLHKAPNPNRDLIEQLAKAGVKFYVCGQSSDYNGFGRQDILPEIGIALSAMTQLTVLQSQGYALLP